MERPKNEKQFTLEQQHVKRYLNKRYGKAVFNSIIAPEKSTEQYLIKIREALSKPDVFDTIGYKVFREIGPINHKKFLMCLEAIDRAKPLRSTMLDKVVDHVIDRPSLKFEMLAAEVAYDHLVNVEWALNEMKKKPLSRDLSWLSNPKVTDEEMKLRWREVDDHAMQEFEKLKHRYFLPSVSPGVNAERLIKSEVKAFSSLLEPGHQADNWHDLEDYPVDALMGKVDISELYIAARDLQKGKLLDVISSPYSGRRKLMAKVMGVILYLDYLEGELLEEKTGTQQPQVVQHVHNDYRTIIDGPYLTQVNAVLVKNELRHTENNLTYKTELNMESQSSKGFKDENLQSSDLKFLLDMSLNEHNEWKRRLVEVYNRLTGQIGNEKPLIKCSLDTFMAVFLEGHPLSGRIIWLEANKPLGYFLHVLCGADFKDSVKDKSRPVKTIQTVNRGVFIPEVNQRKNFAERVENCFANKDGSKRTGKSTLESRARTYLIGDLQTRLSDTAMILVKG